MAGDYIRVYTETQPGVWGWRTELEGGEPGQGCEYLSCGEGLAELRTLTVLTVGQSQGDAASTYAASEDLAGHTRASLETSLADGEAVGQARMLAQSADGLRTSSLTLLDDGNALPLATGRATLSSQHVRVVSDGAATDGAAVIGANDGQGFDVGYLACTYDGAQGTFTLAATGALGASRAQIEGVGEAGQPSTLVWRSDQLHFNNGSAVPRPVLDPGTVSAADVAQALIDLGLATAS